EKLLFTNGEVVEVAADFETTLDLPSTIGGGISYQVSDKLTLALDAEVVMWSKFKGFDFSFSNYEASGGQDYFDNRFYLTNSDYPNLQQMIFTDLSAPVVWKDAAKVMFGANYQASNFLDLRVGFSSDQSAVDFDNPGGATQIPQFIDLGTKYNYSFGFCFNIDVWSIEFSTIYTHHPDFISDTTADQDINGDGLIDNIAATYSADNYRTVLGFNYRF
ncbi:MAG: hypothetical protein GY865_06895, partial [candidate division Zixibacteria bacterium]|nr:hypothetical protein [candidate division Zixibacteria bacterium]